MNRTISYLPSTRRELLDLPTRCLPEVIELVDSLAEDPAPPGSKQLVGHQDHYRIAFCNRRYRLIYRVRPEKILIVRVRLRGEAYVGL